MVFEEEIVEKQIEQIVEVEKIVEVQVEKGGDAAKESADERSTAPP